VSSDRPRRLGRRELFARGGALAGASALGGASGYAAARQLEGGDEASPAATGASGPRRRRLFALDGEYVNLTTFLLASHPRPVREAIERHRRALDANAALYLQESEVTLEDAARAAVAGYLGAPPDQVALTDSTTMGIGLVYARLRLEPGDEILTTDHDFYATHEALRLRERIDGARVRRIGLYDAPESASVDAIASAVARALGARTRCLALTWVHSSTGVKLPLREIANAVRDANRGRRADERILLCVDAVHGFGVEDASPFELGVDVFISGCHKWLFGPRGTGLIWAAPHAWERLEPTIPSFDARAYGAWLEGRAPTDTPHGPLMSPGGFHSFEHRWALADAIGIHDELGGRARVADQTHKLAARLRQGLTAIRGVRLRTPADESLSAGLVCADVAGADPRDVVERLRQEHRVMASVTPYSTRHLRFGPSVANTMSDVDSVIEAVAAVARG
jgi:selenocysteine lyase/cysteine desulfurase